MFGQNNIDSTVAKAGDKIINRSTFQNRYEYSPHLTDSEESPESMKKKFLYSLIAEKLWALEAEQLRIDTTQMFYYQKKFYQDLLLKDILYQKEVVDAISIGENEIREAMSKLDTTVSFQMIVGKDSTEIFELSSKILSETAFNTILSKRPEFSAQAVPVKATFGKFDDLYLEQKILTADSGFISRPMKTLRGWIIFRISDKELNFDYLDKPEKKHEEGLKILSKRKEISIADELREKIMSNVSAQIITTELTTISRICFEELSKNANNEDAEKLRGEHLTNALYSSKMFKPFDKFVITAEDEFLNIQFALYLSLYQIEKGDISYIHQQILKIAEFFIEDIMLAKFSQNKGYLNDLELRDDLLIRTDHILAGILTKKTANNVSITRQETDSLYKVIFASGKMSKQVNISVISGVSQEIMNNILMRVEYGEEFTSLSRKYTTTGLFANDSGKTGFVAINAIGQYGEIAWNLKEGEVFGPAVVHGELVLIKLHAKREQYIPPPALEEVKEYLKERMYATKLDSVLRERTVTLAKKYGFRIQEGVFYNTQVQELNTFLIRKIGFGGKISAFPVTIPLYNWYDKKLEDNIKISF